MLKSLKISNFQSHRDTNLELDSGVNVIIGPSDSGKTSILRALRWLIWNRPSGDDFRSTWGGDTIVDIWVNNGQAQRIRTKKDNLYLLGYHDEFKAMGTDVPAEVQQLLNINEINLQQQMDSPFLLTNSPGEVAAHFNKIAKLSKIDTSLSNINKWIRDIISTTKHKEADLKDKEMELKGYDHLEKFEAEVEVLEELEKRYAAKFRSQGALLALIDDLVDLGKEIDETSEILKDEDLVNNTLDLIYKRDGLEDGPIASIEDLLDQIEACKADRDVVRDIISAEDVVNNLLQLTDQLRKKEKDFETLDLLVDSVAVTKNKILLANREHDQKQAQFDKEFPDICPLCNKPK